MVLTALVGLALIVVVVLVIVKFPQIEGVVDFDSCIEKGYPVLDSFPEQCETPDGKKFIKKVASKEITVTGVSVCLPHKDREGPQTLECALGIETAEGYYYQLSDIGSKFPELSQTETRFMISGKVTSPAPANIYDILGVIEVTQVSPLN
jgi:hypothetical protein